MNEAAVATIGTPIRIRPIDKNDVEHIGRFYGGLSDESRRLRFLSSGTQISAQAATTLCGPDHVHQEGFVAVREGDDDVQIVGHLCLEPTGPGEAEVAVAVSDAEQGHGVGRRLMTEALRWAGRHRIDRLSATCAVGNSGILGLLRGLGRPITYGPMVAGTQELSIDLSVDARPHQVAA